MHGPMNVKLRILIKFFTPILNVLFLYWEY